MAHDLLTSVTIDAPADRVWAVLADLDRYGEWNPHILEARGTLAAGERLRLRFAGMRIRPRVLRAEPGRELRWIGRLGVRGLFDGEHSFVLTPLPDGGTRVDLTCTYNSDYGGVHDYELVTYDNTGGAETKTFDAVTGKEEKVRDYVVTELDDIDKVVVKSSYGAILVLNR